MLIWCAYQEQAVTSQPNPNPLPGTAGGDVPNDDPDAADRLVTSSENGIPSDVEDALTDTLEKIDFDIFVKKHL